MKFDIIVKDMDGVTREAVDGRQLHEAMSIKTRYDVWAKRQIKDLGLCKLLDYEVMIKTDRNSKGGKQVTTEYVFSVDAAKHIAMVQRNAKGRAVRDYFIEREKEAARLRKENDCLINMLEGVFLTPGKILPGKSGEVYKAAARLGIVQKVDNGWIVTPSMALRGLARQQVGYHADGEPFMYVEFSVKAIRLLFDGNVPSLPKPYRKFVSNNCSF
ncbi:antA/AntB antirepressor family protein [Escherichia coli]|nr:antA/AntB antirepressor family protein [Escherichia coli]